MVAILRDSHRLCKGRFPARKNVLFVYGGWGGHDPNGCREVFVRTVNAQ